jgi:hypothetical protein
MIRRIVALSIKYRCCIIKSAATMYASMNLLSLGLATVAVLDLAGFIVLCGNSLTPSKIDDFSSIPSL